MLNSGSLRNIAHEFTNFITFIDLPIRKKFLLFAVGVLFWFVAMFAVIMVGMYNLEGKSETIIKRVLPQERAAQMIIIHLQRVIIEGTELTRFTNPVEIMKKVETSSEHLSTASTLINGLKGHDAVYGRSSDSGGITGMIFPSAIADDQETEKYLSEMVLLASAADKQFNSLVATKISSLSQENGNSESLRLNLDELRRTLDLLIAHSNKFAEKVAGLYIVNTDNIKSSIHLAITAGASVLAIATILLAIFTFWISRSIARPVTSMIEQIHSLSRGEVDISKKISISSKDEIGVLSGAFNGLMESIYGMSAFKRVIEEDDSLEQVYSRLGKIIDEQCGFGDSYMVYEVSNSQNKMKAVHPQALIGDEIACGAEIFDNCNLCKAKKTGRLVSSLEFKGTCHQFIAESGTEHVCIPMMVGGSAGGVVQLLINSKEYEADTQKIGRNIFRAKQYVNESVPVIEAKRLMGSLRDSALTDALTGLHNRRFLQEYTEKLVAGVRRRGKVVGLIMCDLDYFKQVNDVHGHNAGDIVLKETALIIRKSIREADIVIRFGGEEFLIVLIDIKDSEAEMIAEKIRANIEKARIKIPQGNIIAKTISLGVSEFPNDTEGFWQAIKFADVALYKAKDAGRNRVVRYAEGMWSEPQF